MIGSIISFKQSAFISGWQILDGPLMVNEIINQYKSQKKTLMVFKIVFEKAYDFISLGVLEQIMHFMGFGSKWVNWIWECLYLEKTSILINGSLMDEFIIVRGFLQCSPLSMFLFIIVMESLHVAI